MASQQSTEATANPTSARHLARLANLDISLSESDRSLLSNFVRPTSSTSLGDNSSIGSDANVTALQQAQQHSSPTSAQSLDRQQRLRNAAAISSTSFQYRRNPHTSSSSVASSVIPSLPFEDDNSSNSNINVVNERLVSNSSLSVENNTAPIPEDEEESFVTVVREEDDESDHVSDEPSHASSEARDQVAPLLTNNLRASVTFAANPCYEIDVSPEASPKPTRRTSRTQPGQDDAESPGPSNLRTSISFGSTRDIVNKSIIKKSNRMESNNAPRAVATAVAADDASEASGSSLRYGYNSSSDVETHSMPAYHPDAAAHPEDKKSALKRKEDFKKKRANRLSKISQKYDLDGNGELDEIEQAMRDRDVDGDGNLDNREVYRIVQDQLKNQTDVKLFKKIAGGLTCLVAILSLSNFATSWASAILARDTVADPATGTIQSKSTHEVMGLNNVAHEMDLEPLTDEEFEERRLMVDAEMAEDPEHEDHIHRRLGRKNTKNACTCTKVAYDHGKLKEKDLQKLIRKCDGVNTVTIKRMWESGEYDVDTICGPGTNVVKKGKKKKNKKETKTKVVETAVKFRRQGGGGGGRNNRDNELNFDCRKGECYASGQTLIQQEGHNCEISRDRNGAGECDDGLVCYDPQGRSRGTGTCTRLVRFAPRNMACDVDYGVDACVDGCGCNAAATVRSTTVGVVNTGTCQLLARRGSNQDSCNASFGDDACVDGYTCIGENGSELNGFGIGFCQQLVRGQRSGGLCDLSFTRNGNACADGYYCRDSMLARNGVGGVGGNGVGVGGTAWTGAIISGPSGVVGGGNQVGGIVGQQRSVGTGMCTRTVSRMGQCGSDLECGIGSTCRGLGDDTATGGRIVGSSGTIVWGTGGSTIGYCT